MKKIRIGPVAYSVVRVADLKSDETELMGCIEYHNERILIRSGMPKQTTQITLLHEIIHGLLSTAGTQEHSEQVIDAIAFGLFELARNNPRLLKINFEEYADE